LVISGIYNCPECGEPRDFGEAFELPPAPFKIQCKKCGAAIIESVPEDLMNEWAEDIEKSLTEEEKKVIAGEIPPPKDWLE